MNDDARWMSLALAEARKGVGRTAPNPPVGAVIVKDGELLGRGWHRAAGQPHAEREALADVFRNHGKDSAKGATAYVTLEPCSTHGRTPPCTDGLIEGGIARVVYACVDRNPTTSVAPMPCSKRRESRLCLAYAPTQRGNCYDRFSKSIKPGCHGSSGNPR